MGANDITRRIDPESMIIRAADFRARLKKHEQVRQIVEPTTYLDRALRAMFEPDERSIGRMPWSKTHADVQYREAEVSVIAAANGSGKSMFLSQVALSLAAQGQKVLIASFEMPVDKQLKRMWRQAARSSEPSLVYCTRLTEWMRGRLWFYDEVGSVRDFAMLLDGIRYAASELGVRHVVLDSLMKLVRGADDYDAQKQAVDALCALSHELRIHIHLVHHIRKLDSEARVPDKTDIKGAGDITDLVDNVWILWRNKPKEAKRREGLRVEPDEADALLICCKQRDGEGEPYFTFWYDPQSQQFCASSDARPTEIVGGVA